MRCDAQSRSNDLQHMFETDCSSMNLQLVKRIACILGSDVLPVLLPHINKLVEASATRQQHCTALELIGGPLFLTLQRGL